MNFKGRRQNNEQEIAEKNAEVQDLRQKVSNPKSTDHTGANEDSLRQAKAELAALSAELREQRLSRLGGRIRGGSFDRDVF